MLVFTLLTGCDGATTVGAPPQSPEAHSPADDYDTADGDDLDSAAEAALALFRAFLNDDAKSYIALMGDNCLEGSDETSFVSHVHSYHKFYEGLQPPGSLSTAGLRVVDTADTGHAVDVTIEWSLLRGSQTSPIYLHVVRTGGGWKETDMCGRILEFGDVLDSFAD